MFILTENGKGIVINQEPSSLPDSDRSAPETKVKDPKRQGRDTKSHEMSMKKLKEKLLKDNQEAQMNLKEFIEYFQQYLNDPVSFTNGNRRNYAYYERKA